MQRSTRSCCREQSGCKDSLADASVRSPARPSEQPLWQISRRAANGTDVHGKETEAQEQPQKTNTQFREKGLEIHIVGVCSHPPNPLPSDKSRSRAKKPVCGRTRVTQQDRAPGRCPECRGAWVRHPTWQEQWLRVSVPLRHLPHLQHTGEEECEASKAGGRLSPLSALGMLSSPTRAGPPACPSCLSPHTERSTHRPQQVATDSHIGPGVPLLPPHGGGRLLRARGIYFP